MVLGPVIRRAVALAAAVCLVATGSAAAFSGAAAASYADSYATNRNLYWPAISNDCANFVSQSLYAGGYPMHGVGGNTADNRNWYMRSVSGTWTWTQSWSFARYLYIFLATDSPGG